MQLFTNKSKTRFFTTSNAIEGLTSVDIASVNDFIGIDTNWNPLVLVSWGSLRANGQNEVSYHNGFDEEPTGEVLTFDFIEGLSEAEVAKQIIEANDFANQVAILKQMVGSWEYDSDYEEDTENFLFTAEDGSQVCAYINDSEKSVTCELAGKP